MRVSYNVLLAAILAIAGTNAFAADVPGLATTNYVDGAINSLPDVARTGSYKDLADTPTIPAAQVNSDWNATSGAAQILNKPTLGALAEKSTVTSADITDGTITNDDIAANAAIATSKISGLDTALTGKQATANIVNPNASNEFADGDANSTTKYPSMKAAQEIAKAAVSGVSAKVTALEGITNGLGTLATKDAVGSGDITDGSIAAVDLAANSVTTAKIADKNVTKGKLEDSVQTSLGKADNSLQKAASATFTDGHVLKADASGNIVDGGALGTLATKSAVGSADITDGSIVADDLAANSVTTAKIADKNVTKGKLEDSVQTSLGKADNSLQKAASATFTDGHVLKADASGNIVDGGALGSLATKSAVGSAEITDGSIAAVDLAANSVTTAKIDNGAVTAAKTSGVIGYIPSGSATSTTYAQIWVE